MTRNLIALLLGASALTACAAGPDYRPPATPTSAAKSPSVFVAVTASCLNGKEASWSRRTPRMSGGWRLLASISCTTYFVFFGCAS